MVVALMVACCLHVAGPFLVGRGRDADAQNATNRARVVDSEAGEGGGEE